MSIPAEISAMATPDGAAGDVPVPQAGGGDLGGAGRVVPFPEGDAGYDNSRVASGASVSRECRGRSRGVVKSKVRRVPIDDIKVDQAIQQRVNGTSEEVVAEYAQAMRDGAAFPPPVVFKDRGGSYYLADGFHRFEAYRRAHPDVNEIECEVHRGDHGDALLFACGANASHGLPRTNADKRASVRLLLNSEEWSKWSDHQIAQRCKVSHSFVGKLRHLETFPDTTDAIAPAHPETFPDTGQKGEDRAAHADAHTVAADRRRTFKRGGKQHTMKTAGIVASRATASKPAAPRPSLTSLAWSDASELEQRKFVDGAGARSIANILKTAPSFDLLNWAWGASGQDERRAFADEHREEINVALANQVQRMPLRPASADQSSASASAPARDADATASAALAEASADDATLGVA